MRLLKKKREKLSLRRKDAEYSIYASFAQGYISNVYIDKRDQTPANEKVWQAEKSEIATLVLVKPLAIPKSGEGEKSVTTLVGIQWLPK